MIHRRGEGTVYRARGSEMVFKATSGTTRGAFSLMEREVPAGMTAPPLHRHEGAEGFYVLGGEIEVTMGDVVARCAPGDFALVPGGVAHTFTNRSGSPARILIIHAPAADVYFRDLEALWSEAEPPSADAQRELLERHGIEPA